MSKLKKRIILILLLSIVPIGIAFYYLILPAFITVEINEALPFEKNENSSQLVLAYKGDFEKVDYNVKGDFAIYNDNGKKILRINDLEILGGPDLHLVFSNEKSSFTKNYEIIKKLPANKGSYNVEIPENLDPADFQFLLIHCVRFRHTFAGATINKNI